MAKNKDDFHEEIRKGDHDDWCVGQCYEGGPGTCTRCGDKFEVGYKLVFSKPIDINDKSTTTVYSCKFCYAMFQIMVVSPCEKEIEGMFPNDQDSE